MAIEYLDHTADVAFRATGTSLEAAFVEAARALFGVMIDVDRVQPLASHTVELKAPDLKGLLVAWLADLLAQKDLSGLVFSRFTVRIQETRGGFSLEAQVQGERLDAHRHGVGSEVKGISLLGLDVRAEPNGWTVRCVLDV